MAQLAGAGKDPVMVFSFDDTQMAWYELGKDSNAEFIAHTISDKFPKDKSKDAGVFRYSHGLGVGDINGDKRPDVLIRGGYWEAPADPRQPNWKFVPKNFGDEAAQMYVYDVDGDGLNDVLSSSAHKIGIWWHQQQKDGSFVTRTIDGSFSQSHALELVDINGDGLKDLVTGKRFWAHGPNGDINPNDPAVVHVGDRAGRHRDQHHRQQYRGLHQGHLVGRGGHLRHRPGGADAPDQKAQIGEQSRRPDTPEHRKFERRREAVGAGVALGGFGHIGSVISRSGVMPAKSLSCPEVKRDM